SSSVLHSRLPRLWFLRTVTPCTATYTQSLHDALPICVAVGIKYPKNFRTEGYASSPSRSCGCPALKVRRVSLEFPARMGSQVKIDRKSTRLNSSHVKTSYAVFCLKKNIRHRQNSNEVS